MVLINTIVIKPMISSSQTILVEITRFLENSSNRNYESKFSNPLQKEEIKHHVDY